MWVPRHRADIESDMSAVHRVDDIETMNSARLFRLAWRLPCYRGVMRERVLSDQQQEQAPAAQVRQASPSARPAAPSRSTPVTEAALADPVMGKIFDFG